MTRLLCCYGTTKNLSRSSLRYNDQVHATRPHHCRRLSCPFSAARPKLFQQDSWSFSRQATQDEDWRRVLAGILFRTIISTHADAAAAATAAGGGGGGGCGVLKSDALLLPRCHARFCICFCFPPGLVGLVGETDNVNHNLGHMIDKQERAALGWLEVAMTTTEYFPMPTKLCPFPTILSQCVSPQKKQSAPVNQREQPSPQQSQDHQVSP